MAEDLSHRHGAVTDLFGPVDGNAGLSAQQRDGFERDGFVGGVALLSPDQLAALRKEVDELLRPDHDGRELWYEHHSNESADPDNVLFHALGAWRLRPALHDLLWAPAFVRAAEQLLGGPVRFWHDQLFCKPAHHGGVVAWHQDYSYWTRTQPMQHLTCWIGLDDSTEENGCIHYVPGSHRWPLLPRTDLANDMEAILQVLTPEQRAAFQPVPCQMPAGHASFHHPLTVHGSHENRSDRPRRAVVLNVVRDGTISDQDAPLLEGGRPGPARRAARRAVLPATKRALSRPIPTSAGRRAILCGRADSRDWDPLIPATRLCARNRIMDESRLHNLVGQTLGDLGGAFGVPLVRMGMSLGLYGALHERGPMTPAQMATATGLAERYLKEWLCAQAASNYVTYDPAAGSFSLTPEQAAVFADENSPFYLAPAFETAAAFLANQPHVQHAFTTGEGVPWGDQSECLSCAVAKFFRPGYQNHLVTTWLPALDGVVERLQAGIDVADVGCGHGVSTVIMAQAFPNSRFVGFDFHEESIETARAHAAEHRVENVRFETAIAKSIPGRYGLVAMFDCLHDMGDPVGVMRHLRSCLDDQGACLLVEPMANDAIEENLNPVGRMYYSASTMVCVPTSLAQEVGAALGAQAGETKLREVIVDGAGFGSLRRATETPFNLILEARP